MKIHQAGAVNERVSRKQIDDWSWARTVRRASVLVRLAKPYRARVLGGVVTLLVATAAALAPLPLGERALADV